MLKMSNNSEEKNVSKRDDFKKLINHLEEKDRSIEIEIPNHRQIALIEKMVGVPFWYILNQNIYHFLVENYTEIKVANILTSEEEHLLDLIYKYSDDIIGGLDILIKEDRRLYKL
jgi:hypothetical protein